MATPLPFVSVVLPALDADGLRECLVSLSAVDYPPDRHEVIVAGADPAAGTASVAAQFPVRYVRADRRSVSAARNRGIEESRGEIVAFTDPDCVVTTAWLRQLVEAFGDAEVGAVAGGIIPYPPASPAERYMALRRSHTQERPLAHPTRPFGMSPNLAFRREVFHLIGMFDERFPGGGWEDADLCWRFHAAGLRLEHAADAAVFHRYRATVRDFLVQQYRYGYGMGVLFRKYRSEIPAEWPRRAGSLRELASSVAALVYGTFRPAARGDMGGLGFRCFDVLRQVGQRSGFWAASLSRSGS